MAKKATIPFNDLINVFKYQGIATLDQAEKSLGQKYPYTTIKFWLDKFTKSSKAIPNAFLWSSTARKPWRETQAGRTPKLYGITKAGKEKIMEVTGVDIDVPENKLEKNTLHALALVDIALVCDTLGYECKINRQVNISAQSDEATPTYLKPDIQFIVPENAGITQFVEFEQKRFESNLYTTLQARMYRWEGLLTGPDRENYSKNILVLFWFGEKVTKDASTMDTWSQALYDFEEKIGHKASFNVYSMNFIDFVARPTFDPANYTLLVPLKNPKDMRLEQERESHFQKEATQIFTNLDKESSSKALNDYADQYRDLWIRLQNASNRQEFFFTQVKKLYEMSNCDMRAGYAEASIPWAAVFLVRFWIEQEQLKELREDLTIALTLIYLAATKNQLAGAMAYENMVWDVLFRFFNFSSGGPLKFRVITLSTDSMDRCYDLAPDTRIETPWIGVFADASEAEPYQQAINWFINTLVHYQRELGLVKGNRRGRPIKKSTKEAA